MKTFAPALLRACAPGTFTLVAILAALGFAPIRAQAQPISILVGTNDGMVTRYDGVSGDTPSQTWQTQLPSGYINGMAICNSLLFLANTQAGVVQTMNFLNGQVINGSFFTDVNTWSVAASQTVLFVGDQGDTVSAVDPTTGLVISSDFITGFFPISMTDYNGLLYVLGGNKVSVYNDTTFALVNGALISTGGSGIAVNANGIFVSGSSVASYGLDGTPINSNLIPSQGGFFTGDGVVGNDVFVEDASKDNVLASDITGNLFGDPLFTVSASPRSLLTVPEPAVWPLLAGGVVMLLAFYRRFVAAVV